MDSSIFYRGSCFEKKTENIFGLTEELIKNFLDAKLQEEQEKEQKKSNIKPAQAEVVQKKVPEEMKE